MHYRLERLENRSWSSWLKIDFTIQERMLVHPLPCKAVLHPL